ncbi:MAG: hypothetical protein WC969_05810 [Elusimicrobiota bacterium]|jgi:hypothetical protein
MLQLLLILSMSPALTAPSTTAAVKPCLFPNTCGPKRQAFTLAAVKPCQWPNTCGPKTA